MKPSARRNEVRTESETIQVRVVAPATEGKANAELERFLSERLALPRTAVKVVRGRTTRHKVVEVSGLSQDTVLRRLGGKG